MGLLGPKPTWRGGEAERTFRRSHGDPKLFVQSGGKLSNWQGKKDGHCVPDQDCDSPIGEELMKIEEEQCD